jgi:hypothetical protein
MPGPIAQTGFFEEIPPVRGGNPIYCHQEFLERMEENRANTVGRRAALLMHRLLVNLNRQYYKPTQGDNRGWRRSPLGGGGGCHWYAWWAPRGAAPLKGAPDFESAPEGSIFLRAIRHHDDHDPLNPQSLDEYLPVPVKDLRAADYIPAPWTQHQARFANARQKIRLVKGFPGSGKTTALWHAADLAGRESVLYLTYSPELAALAREHFDRFVPGQKKFRVETFAQFIRTLVGSSAPYQPVSRTRAAFVKAISGFSTSILGPWQNEKNALYDEIHAHLLGAAMPFPAGRFPAIPDRRMSVRDYRDHRQKSLGRSAAESVVEIAETLRKRTPSPIEPQFFPELDLAWQAVKSIRSNGPGEITGFDCLALDEAQDLTPIEALVIVELAAALPRPVVLVAGDEAQTVRPTDFEWGWFQDLIHHRLGQPIETKLQINLRSPQRIALLVNRVWSLYGALAKHERPSGSGSAEIDANAGDQIVFCIARPGAELDELLTTLTAREGLAVIALGDEIPSYVPPNLRDRVLTTFDAKGLDFQSVCVLDAGKAIDHVAQLREHGRGLEIDDLTKRLAIDQLRVAFSRPAERLYWLEVNPSDRARHAAEAMLTFDQNPYPLLPAGLVKALEEESLDPEERVRLCENDARQLLEVRPVMAWSRAQQAVALLGDEEGKLSVSDPEARKSAFLTLSKVSLRLALTKVNLPAEFGHRDLFMESAKAAGNAGYDRLHTIIRGLGLWMAGSAEQPDREVTTLTRLFSTQEKYFEDWLIRELQPYSGRWIESLEQDAEVAPMLVYEDLPVLYRLFRPAEAAQLTAKLRGKAIAAHIVLREFDTALALLSETENPAPAMIAMCHEGLGQFELAASEFLAAGSPTDALRCYRRVPDFDRTLELLEQVPDHPARESLEWLRRMRDLAAQRPADFNKRIMPEEKKLLEELLESSVGAARKKPGTKKPAAAKKAPAPKKVAAPPKKVAPPIKKKRELF